MSDPVSGFTFTLVSRINYIARMAEIVAGLEIFEEAATGATADELVTLIQKYMPEWTGDLKASVTKQQLSVEPPVWAVGPTAEYAPYVEYGTGPHIPNVDNLTAWADDHGWDASEIISHIAANGTAAHPFMQPAIEEAKGMGADMFFDTVSFGLVSGAGAI